ncbi:hypothetical protein HHS_00280 [Candidatus Pantoea carbekii]|uniref:Uncharacterized protein n=1 Tax=Candidatus Pantoea carbekii TaxID=1235990 RepID=U3U8Q0_9GAMM|nr:hypothetical protein HHS_00280 [Candidatus Pantoea carbekii]
MPLSAFRKALDGSLQKLSRPTSVEINILTSMKQPNIDEYYELVKLIFYYLTFSVSVLAQNY